jgi:hypothetical protein
MIIYDFSKYSIDTARGSGGGRGPKNISKSTPQNGILKHYGLDTINGAKVPKRDSFSVNPETTK